MSQIVNVVLGLVGEMEKKHTDSEFYKNYMELSKEYEQLILLGITKKRESNIAGMIEEKLIDSENYNSSKISACQY